MYKMKTQIAKHKFTPSFFLSIALLGCVVVAIFGNIFNATIVGFISYMIFYFYHKITNTDLPKWVKSFSKRSNSDTFFAEYQKRNNEIDKSHKYNFLYSDRLNNIHNHHH